MSVIMRFLRHMADDVEAPERPTLEEIEPDRRALPPTPEQHRLIDEAFANPELRRRHGW